MTAEALRGVAKLSQVSRGSAPWRLRRAMGRFATGVTVVTTAERDQVHGMTANGVMSVSLDPPLIVVSLGASKMDDMLPRTRRYGVSVLSAKQETLAKHFAGRPLEDAAPKFTWFKELPFIDGALAHVGCRVEAIHDAGDHRLWVGRVEYMEYEDGEPLIFYAGRFGHLNASG